MADEMRVELMGGAADGLLLLVTADAVELRVPASAVRPSRPGVDVGPLVATWEPLVYRLRVDAGLTANEAVPFDLVRE